VVDVGASLTAGAGGKIMLFGPTVRNNGEINTKDGQVILAAGQQIYLTSSSNANLRGILVQLDDGGTVTNQGKIYSDLGNITLAGRMVNQNNRLTATTSVLANGSITLKAVDQTVANQTSYNSVDRYSTRGGFINLGANSVTEVLPKLQDSSTVLNSTYFLKSSIDLYGGIIHLMSDVNGGASIVAPGGNITISASDFSMNQSDLNPYTPIFTDNVIPNSSRVYIDSGSLIDVSGVGSGSRAEKPLDIPVSNNIVLAELRANELRDSPLQRAGILYTSKVYVDSRVVGLDGSQGTSVANVSGYTSQIGSNIGQKLSDGGKVNITSEGDIIFSPGAKVNVSGGLINYVGADVISTSLISSNGLIYDISVAPKDQTYVSIINNTRYEQGYVQGGNAGFVSFISPAMVLQGSLSGEVVAGIHQINSGSNLLGGSLQIGQSLNKYTNILHSDILFDSAYASAPPAFSDSMSLQQKQQLILGSNFSFPAGFSTLKYYADGQISLASNSAIETINGGTVLLSGSGIDISGNITSRGGSINLVVAEKDAYVGSSINFKNNARQSILIGDGVTLDVSGLWINDLFGLSTSFTRSITGGKIQISAKAKSNADPFAEVRMNNGDITIAPSALLDASGGAWLNYSSELQVGSGGSISLLAGVGSNKGMLTIPKNVLRADSISKGGQLTLSSGSITIGSSKVGTPGETLLPPETFTQGGFTSFTINSSDSLLIQDGTTLEAYSQSRVLNRGYEINTTGTEISRFSELITKPSIGSVAKRNATDLSFNAQSAETGIFTLGNNAKILMDAGANLTINGDRQLTILGTIVVPGGNVSMTLGHTPSLKDTSQFLDNQTLWLGANSLIDVSGIADVYINSYGMNQGVVKNGGEITLTALKGAIVAQQGESLNINISGSHALIDIKNGMEFVKKDVASSGGGLTISSLGGIYLDANIKAKGGSSLASGGFLSVKMTDQITPDYNIELNSEGRFPETDREIIIDNIGQSIPSSLNLYNSIPRSLEGKAFLFASKLANAEFESLSFSAIGNIRFHQDVVLTARGSLSLDTPNIFIENSSQVKLESSYVGVGNSYPIFQGTTVKPSQLGDSPGTLSVTANYINLFGNQNLSGVSAGNFNSYGDIQLSGVLSIDPSILNPLGSLNSAGSLNFEASKIYPSTLSKYLINTPTDINFFRNLIDSGTPYSVMGELSINAGNIYQAGVIRAPFGVINLVATNQLTLASGSLTSVSADGKTLLFGNTSNGIDWTYYFNDRNMAITSLPDKVVNLSGKSIDIQSAKNDDPTNKVAAAKVDVAGGGDLKAWEFTTGPIGSSDVLNQSGAFAILPSLNERFMPGNSESNLGNSLKMGEMIYLSGGNGLAPGSYVVLPAHYALMNGGYLVKPIAGYQDFAATQNTSKADGSMLVSGYFMHYGGMVSDSRNSGFLIASGGVVRSQSEFTETYASSFFSQAYKKAGSVGLTLPVDAGKVSINASNNLLFNGIIASGQGGKLDISSSNIAISLDGSYSLPGYLSLSSIALNKIGFESILIGGTRYSSLSGANLNVSASNVLLIGDAKLVGQDFMLAAKDTISIAQGTSIEAKGFATLKDAIITIGNATPGSSDGAFLRVSTGDKFQVIRQNISPEQTINSGTLDISGNISQAKTVILDATSSNQINGNVSLLSGGSLIIGAPKISFGNAPSGSVGLLINDDRLSALGNPSNLKLKSYSTVDFFGNVTIGKVVGDNTLGISSLEIDSAGINGYGSADNLVVLNTQTLKLSNSSSKDFVSNNIIRGSSLVVNSLEIVSGSNTFNINGFEKVTFNAYQFLANGSVGLLDVLGNLTINANRITSASQSRNTIHASGLLKTQTLLGNLFNGDDPTKKLPELGGALTLSASTLLHAGNIEMPGGIVTLKSTAEGDSLTLDSGSNISAKGFKKLGNVAMLIDAGSVNLESLNGNIIVNKNAVVDVSAKDSAQAGTLNINSFGTVDLLGTLNGIAIDTQGVAIGAKGAKFNLQSYTLKNLDETDRLSQINALLENGNFSGGRNIHVLNGNLTILERDTLTTNNLTLSTDDGNIVVAGEINASGIRGGLVSLNVGQQNNDGMGNIWLKETAKINVQATGFGVNGNGMAGHGGEVLLNSMAYHPILESGSDISPSNGTTITIDPKSIIDLRGAGQGADGTLVLRAIRKSIAGTDQLPVMASISINNVRGANAKILVEGVKTYNTYGDLSIDSQYVSSLKSDNQKFIENESQIKTSLSAIGSQADSRLTLVAGDEIRATGKIYIDNDFELQSWGAGALTLRAKNDIFVNKSISAGFTPSQYFDEDFNSLTKRDDLGNTFVDSFGTLTNEGGHWSYRIVAGANLFSSDFLQTNNISSGNLILASNTMIRTGIGEVSVSTAGDISFGQNSKIYTAGAPDQNIHNELGSFNSHSVYLDSTQMEYPIAYPIDGGNIVVISKGSIAGLYQPHLASDWLFRQGRLVNSEFIWNPSWGPFFQDFNENVGALGGGNVTISAYHDINNISAVTSTNGRVFGNNPTNGKLIVNGGGDLTVGASDNIYGGFFMVDGGAASIRANKDLLPSQSKLNSTLLALGNGNIDIQTGGELKLLTVYNPLFTAMSSDNTGVGSISFSNLSFYSTYNPASSVTLQSISGGVTISTDQTNSLANNIALNNLYVGAVSSVLNILPPSLKIFSTGDIKIAGQVTLYPSAQSDLIMASNGSIIFKDGKILMSDIDPILIPSPFLPSADIRNISDLLNGTYGDGPSAHASMPVHYEDSKAIELFASKDIIGNPNNLSLILPKKAKIVAGNDVVDLWINSQNINQSDVTAIFAGNDFYYNKLGRGDNFYTNYRGVYLGGPGYLNISAGRNIILNNAFGVITQGNLINPFLSEKGASISLQAGSLKWNDENLSENDLYLKHQFLEGIFFNELKQAGVEHNDISSAGYGNYNRGYQVIEKTFPLDAYEGVIDLSGSQIKTERGGNINILNPGGKVIVGLAKIPPSLIRSKRDPKSFTEGSASVLGVFTGRFGDINIFSNDSIEVAQSRVFTILGGDILAWSTLGNIDAGKGAKTAINSPPPVIRTDLNGRTIVDLSGVVSGSGIGTLQTLKDAPLGNVYLIAPSGTVDAGDAGVRSSGNLLVAAQAVANGANMQAGGATSGVPAPSTANVSFSAPVSADSSNSAKQADKATEAASKSANKTASALPSLITVEVLALGDESSTTSDPEKDEKKKAKKPQN